ncbi:hypothetical protein [Acetobacterium sp.]|uniref:hypothetical protein n=1 Tax=Acetobacterium sp. TaxID=1872094 RepID=UPI00271564EC|nr:hypothetical protein [Acetobacterium sp.]MDO9493428.1 hypothetical protein [Acetobacterium sp.]
MRKLITGKLTSGLLCVFMVLSVFFSTGVFAASTEADTSADETNTAAVEEIGVKYCGHVQNKGDMPYVNSPTPLGTRGESLRIEGFCFDLTGPVPAGAKLVYQVHVQNRGWMAPVSSADFAGTRGESLRVESIRISLENLPGYDVYYRGHVQNVGDIPQASGEWGWVKNGADLGTTGSSLRLEEITVKIVKQPTTTTTYDKAGTFGPETGSEEVAGDAIINVPDVTLQNLHIKGNLTIGEGVGSGNVTLNNVTVDGDTFVNGGGKNSIHINGGSYSKIVVQKTASGNVRIVATNVDGLEVVISENAAGEAIILEGDFADVTVNAPDVNISTQGDTTIGNMTVGKNATGCEVTLAEGTKVEDMVLNSGADVKGKGTIDKAEVNADNVKFETAPTEQVVDPGVVVPPVVVPPVVPPTPGGGGTDPSVAALAAVNAANTATAMQDALEDNASALGLSTIMTKTYTYGNTLTYNDLDSGRITALANDMIANRGSGFTTTTAVQNMFDDFTEARVTIEYQLGRANTAIADPTAYPNGADTAFIDDVILSLNGLSNQSLTLSGQPVSTLKADLITTRSLYNQASFTTAKKDAARVILYHGGTSPYPYQSMRSLLEAMKSAYLAV